MNAFDFEFIWPLLYIEIFITLILHELNSQLIVDNDNTTQMNGVFVGRNVYCDKVGRGPKSSDKRYTWVHSLGSDVLKRFFDLVELNNPEYLEKMRTLPTKNICNPSPSPFLSVLTRTFAANMIVALFCAY